MPTASPIRDKTHGDEILTRTVSGWQGRRFFSVDTRDPFLALSDAIGLPTVGTAWAAEIPELKVIRQTTKPWGGDKIFVEVEYQTPGFGGSIPTTLTVPWSELEPSSGNVTQYYDIRAVNGDPANQHNAPINNRDGAPREFGQSALLVHSYYPNGSGLNLPRLIQLDTNRPTNEAPFVVPNLYQLGLDLALDVGQARYGGYRPSRIGNTLEIVHVLHLAVSHDVTWWTYDAELRADAKKTSRIYATDSFAGLW